MTFTLEDSRLENSTLEDALTRLENVAPLFKLMILCTGVREKRKFIEEYGFKSSDEIFFFMLLFFVHWMEETYKRTSIEQGLLLEDLQNMVSEAVKEILGEEIYKNKWNDNKTLKFTKFILNLLTNFGNEIKYIPIERKNKLSINIRYIRIDKIDGRERYILLPESIDMMLLMREVQENLLVDMATLRMKTSLEKGDFSTTLNEIKQIRPVISARIRHLQEIRRKLGRRGHDNFHMYSADQIFKTCSEAHETFDQAKDKLIEIYDLCQIKNDELNVVEENTDQNDDIFKNKNVQMLDEILINVHDAVNDINILLLEATEVPGLNRNYLRQRIGNLTFDQNFQIEDDLLNPILANNLNFDQLEELLSGVFFKPTRSKLFNPQILFNLGRRNEVQNSSENIEIFGDETESYKREKEEILKREDYFRRAADEMIVMISKKSNHSLLLSEFVQKSIQLKKETKIAWLKVFLSELLNTSHEKAKDFKNSDFFSFSQTLYDFNPNYSFAVEQCENKFNIQYDGRTYRMNELILSLEE